MFRLAQNIREQFELSKDDPLTHDPRLYARDLDRRKEIQQEDLEEEVGTSGGATSLAVKYGFNSLGFYYLGFRNLDLSFNSLGFNDLLGLKTLTFDLTSLGFNTLGFNNPWIHQPFD